VSAELSDVSSPEQLRGGLVELFPAPDFFEARQQIIDPRAALLRAADIMNDPALVHHHQTVAEIGGLLH
jgi:hypothetical protein